jgi:hypothetical protein
MTDFSKRIERYDKDKSKEWELPPAQQIEKDRHAKEELPRDRKEEETRRLLFAALGLLCKRFLSIFSSKEKIQAAFVDLRQIAQDLHDFNELIEKLSKEDVSRNPLFTRQFSALWQRLLQDLEVIEAFERSQPELGPKIKMIIETIGSYPPFVDHPLGYYLTEHAGEEWLPVPFMDILAQLYKEHQTSPTRSQLHHTINLLHSALDSLQKSNTLL